MPQIAGRHGCGAPAVRGRIRRARNGPDSRTRRRARTATSGHGKRAEHSARRNTGLRPSHADVRDAHSARGTGMTRRRAEDMEDDQGTQPTPASVGKWLAGVIVAALLAVVLMVAH